MVFPENQNADNCASYYTFLALLTRTATTSAAPREESHRGGTHGYGSLVPPSAAVFSRVPALDHFRRLRFGGGGEQEAAEWADVVQRPGDVLWVPELSTTSMQAIFSSVLSGFLVALIFYHLGKESDLLQLVLQRSPEFDDALVPRQFLIQLPGVVGVVPHVGLRNGVFQFLYFLLAEVQVKDTRAYGILAREIPPTDPRTVLARCPS